MAVKKAEKLIQYFIAVVPPSPIYDQALAFKHHFKDQFNSKASLNSPPHITLHMPFKWKEEKEDELLSRFKNFSTSVKPFALQLLNFNAFPPRVIFIDVAESEQLISLQKDVQRFCKKELNLFNADYKDQPFHPHITLAFRDLKKNVFAEAWLEFKNKKFEAEFIVDRFVLLKHNGRIWEVFKEFALS
jgi:2'-5' RNA ligase